MSDPISVALTSLSTASSMIKVLRSADSAFERGELKLKIAEIAEALADARLAVLDAQETIRSLEARISDLQSGSGSREGLEHKDNLYWFTTPAGKSGPFCPNCFESSELRMPVSQLPSGFNDLAKYQCPKCRALY